MLEESNSKIKYIACMVSIIVMFSCEEDVGKRWSSAVLST